MINKKLFKELYYSKNDTELAILFDTSERTVQRYANKLRAKGEIGFRNKTKSSTTVKKEYYNQCSQVIEALKQIVNNLKPYKIKISPKKVGDTLLVLISDWHIGRLIKDEYGNVIYNEKVFKARIEQFSRELLKLLDKYISRGTPIRDVVMISTGDILDGMGIFSTQETLSEYAPPFQVMLGVEVIQKLILSFLERKLPVRFYGVKGNHGNVKVHGKVTDPNANWDLMMYLMLDFWAKSLLKSDQVSVHYSELDYLNFEVRGWKYHIRHIAPHQSETAAGKAKFLGWQKKHGFDVLCYGHLHHWNAGDRSKTTIIRGGALTAGDEFAESLAEEAEPIQLIWGCNEHRPITFFYPLDLGKKEKKKIVEI